VPLAGLVAVLSLGVVLAWLELGGGVELEEELALGEVIGLLVGL
jgi:hypothetical protein